MNMTANIPLKSPLFTGKHVLSGVYMDKLGDADMLLFKLDGIVYAALEDPSDGYRSCLDYIMGLYKREHIPNEFESVRVVGSLIDNNQRLLFRDVVTGELVLEIGTDNSDDYYPSCILYFNPKGLSINYEKETKSL